MQQPPRPGPIGTLVVGAAIIGVFYMGMRSMNREMARQAPSAPTPAMSISGAPRAMGPLPIPQALVEKAAERGIARIDVTMRVDGLDVAFNGSLACREGNRRLIGRASDGATGSFDAAALDGCIAGLLRDRRKPMPVAIVDRAGPMVPVTYRDALVAELRKAGVEEVVVDTR